MGDYANHKDRIIRDQYQSPGFFYAGDYANHNDLTNRGYIHRNVIIQNDLIIRKLI